MRTSAPPLLPIFRSQLQGELLAAIFLSPAECSISDLANRLAAPVATVHREVSRLERAGVLAVRRVGRSKLISADRSSPVYEPLAELVLRTFGPVTVLARELEGVVGVVRAEIFGSWAARYLGEQGPPPGDIDVLVVGEPDRDDVYDAAQRAERALGREVNTVVVSQDRWERADEPFLRGLAGRPKTTVLTRSHAEENDDLGPGKERVLQMIAGGELERVTADEELAHRIINVALSHLATAEREADLDPVMAYSALYDAARKALTALLQIQGLRPTRSGGHLAVIAACRAQFDPPLGATLRPLDRMRRVRHTAEYPTSSTMIDSDTVREDLPKAGAIVDAARRLVDELPVFAARS